MSKGVHRQYVVLGGALWLRSLLLPALYSTKESFGFVFGQCLWFALFLNVLRQGRIIFRIVLFYVLAFDRVSGSHG